MKNTILLTFGCSWTYGEGSGYVPGMTIEEYEEIQNDPTICWENGWRKKVVDHFNFDHINFGDYGSSNDRQFRLAKKFFTSKKFKDLYETNKKIIILWGTTSLNRYDFWIRMERSYEKIFLGDVESDVKKYNNDKDRLGLALKKFSYDEITRLRELEIDMLFWNQYFKCLNIKNYWFDTFNPFNYKISLNNFIPYDGERLSLSKLIEKEHRKITPGLNFNYYTGFGYLIDKGLVNPYSYHPLKEYYSKIGDYFIQILSDKI